ncbi:hypothetical protein Tco_0561705, partial [Tanacetum coccineum]
MTHITVKKLTEPLKEPEREVHRRGKVARRQKRNESLAIAGRNLFDDEASSSVNSEPKISPQIKSLREPREQVCLSEGDIYDDPSLLRFYQNDDLPPWGNSSKRIEGEEGPDWVVKRKNKKPSPKTTTPTLAITTRSGTTASDPPYPSQPIS